LTESSLETWFFTKFFLLAASVLKSKNMKRRRVLVIDNVPSCPKETEVRNGEMRVIFLN
jgi:hypothetical protein